jgi:hypothetical protein
LLANAQQNLLFEQTLVHATDIEAYDEYLKSTYAKIAQGRLDAGAIVGWDVWKVVQNQDNDYTHMITTISDITDEKEYKLDYNQLMGMSEESAELFQSNVNKIRTIKRRHLWNMLANVTKDGSTGIGEAPNFMVINLMKVYQWKNSAKYEKLELELNPKINTGDARVGWSFHRRLDNFGTDVYYSHSTIDWYNNWKDYIKSNMGPSSVSNVYPKVLTEIDKIRDLKNRILLWKFLEVK